MANQLYPVPSGGVWVPQFQREAHSASAPQDRACQIIPNSQAALFELAFQRPVMEAKNRMVASRSQTSRASCTGTSVIIASSQDGV